MAKEWVIEYLSNTPRRWCPYYDILDTLEEAVVYMANIQEKFDESAWRLRNVRTGETVSGAIF